MSKKYILIFILVLANNLMAVDNAQKSINDSTNFSKFNIHAGAGIVNGIRLGINYRFKNKLSTSIAFGISPFAFFGAGPVGVINTYINYSLDKKKRLYFCPSVSFWSSIDDDLSFVISPNFGYIIYNKDLYYIQLNAGYGIWFLESIDGYRSIGIPNLDIIINLNLKK